MNRESKTLITTCQWSWSLTTSSNWNQTYLGLCLKNKAFKSKNIFDKSFIFNLVLVIFRRLGCFQFFFVKQVFFFFLKWIFFIIKRTFKLLKYAPKQALNLSYKDWQDNNSYIFLKKTNRCQYITKTFFFFWKRKKKKRKHLENIRSLQGIIPRVGAKEQISSLDPTL